MKILAIDLGKFNAVVCLFDTATNQSEFETIATQRWAFEQLVTKTQPEQVVIETSSISSWVHDLCERFSYKVLVANANQEAWRWKNVKRKTDKDDTLKLAKLAALNQISPVYVPYKAASDSNLLRHESSFGYLWHADPDHHSSTCCPPRFRQ